VQGSPATITVSFVVAPADVAPVIANVAASSITSSGAVITWTTDKASSSQVNYGTTTAYGNSSPVNATLVTSHSVTLSGLLASTLYHYQVQSADSAGTLGGTADSTFTTATAAVSSCPCTIWASPTTPSTTTVNDDQAVELGVKFTSDVSGYISGIRFYKGSSNTGTHTGSLWTSSGTLLATATFAGESSSGWQQVNFSTPVAIAASTTYVASYHTSVGYYSANGEYFATSSVNQPPLHALASGTSGGDGVYVYGAGGVFPTSTYDATNYWVDVVFNTALGSQTTYSISGTITGGSGATVTLSGAASATATADSSGNFSFNGVANGNYTITPSEAGYTFTPANKAVTVNNASVTGVSFTATAQTYSISGTITGGSGATVTLSGKSSAATTANGSGSFSFSGLINGSYVITPSLTGYTFTLPSQAVTINGANVTGVSFTAAVAAATYTISGSISPASIGAGSVITLSGSGSGQTTAASNGNFSFGSLQNGAYTLTPSNSSDTFTPASQSVTVNGSNVTGMDFTVQGQQPAPGTPTTVGEWYELNIAADIESGDAGCYAPSQVNWAANDLTITMITAGAPFTCYFNGGTTSQNYLSGSIMTHDLNWAPTAGNPITFEAKIKFGVGWGAFWLLGGNKAANTGCQMVTWTTWDNSGSCQWPVDADDSAEIDIAEENSWSTVTGIQQNLFAGSSPNSSNWASSGGQNGLSNITSNYHVYHLDWSTSALHFAVDGVAGNSITSHVPVNPMFPIIEMRQDSNDIVGGLPSTLTVEYFQVCAGTTCTTPGVNSGNTLFFDNFTETQ
jgi:hypothetical protein